MSGCVLAGGAYCYLAGMSVDADGAPNAYAPAGWTDSSGRRSLDFLANAGGPGRWFGVATHNGGPDGTPIVQGPGDPFPGAYVSQTALVDPSRPAADPLRYADSSKIPYVSVPRDVTRARVGVSGVRVGDVAAVLRGGLVVGAVVADVGPAGEYGEGSIALAGALGLPFDLIGKSAGTGAREVRYAVFANSRTGWPRSPANFQAQALALLAAWGGEARLRSLVG